jgi:hypothetical protein
VSKEVLALALTVLVHVVGMAALVWALLHDDENRPDWRDWWPGGDDDPPAPPPDPRQGGGLPLPDAQSSAVRLREPGRLADGHPRPARRPEHVPERVPARERELP